jgi:DNA repair protein RadC
MRVSRKIKDLPKAERPREKLMGTNPNFLDTSELLAIIIGSGTKNENALRVAKKLLKKYGLENLSSSDLESLKTITGIGNTKACQLLACFELGRRLFTNKKEIFVESPEDVYKLTKEIEDARKEHLIALYLSTNNSLIKKELVSIGSLNVNLVHPREVFQPALANYAANVILVHNHPSGDTEPSEEDVKLTKRMIKAGKLMGVKVLDHVITGNGKYTSLKETGLKF